MTVYAIAQLRITDRAAYHRYQARFMDVFRRHRGRLPVADQEPFRLCAKPPGYQKIPKDRRGGADSVVPLAKGLT